jgi:hypothetical protein
MIKRRNEAGSSRMPSRLAHRARPIRQYWNDATLSRLLPSSPVTPGLDFLQLYPAATTAEQWRSCTSIRNTSASWRTQAASSFTPLLRHQGDGGLSPPYGQTAPRGALLVTTVNGPSGIRLPASG